MKGGARSATRRPGSVLAAALAWFLAIVMLPSDAEAQWGGAMRLQMGFGGDELATVEYDDGSESSLSLGKAVSITIGPVFEAWSSGPSSVELQGMVGWSGWSTGPENTEDRLKLTRFPVELLAFYGYRVPGHDMLLRLGGGATYHLGGGVSGSGSLEGDVDMDFDNALGATGEVSAIFGIISAGLRYTHMSTGIEGLPASLDGSSVGLFFALTTPRG